MLPIKLMIIVFRSQVFKRSIVDIGVLTNFLSMELKEAFIHWFLECSPYSYEILKQQGSPDYKVQVGFGVLKRRVVRMMLTHIDVTRRHLREVRAAASRACSEIKRTLGRCTVTTSMLAKVTNARRDCREYFRKTWMTRLPSNTPYYIG
jgi:hypothetical protein